MADQFENPLKATWAAGKPTIGGWLSLPNSVSAEVAGRAGLDYVCVDAQHGSVDYQIALTMFQAIELGGSVPVARVPWNEPGIVGKMLDAGARGIIAPMVNSPEEAEALVAACRYPPEGSRSFGPTRVGLAFDDYNVAGANRMVACIPMIETGVALDRIDDILAVPGVDAVYIGPSDLSLGIGLGRPGNNDGEPAFDEALAKIVASCQKAGVVPGIHTVPSLLDRRLEQGFQMVTAVADVPALRDAFAEVANRGTSSPEGSMY